MPRDVIPSARTDLVVLTVFFCGTSGGLLRSDPTQISDFYRLAQAQEVNSEELSRKPLPFDLDGVTQFKKGFSGCGVTHGMRGTFFAHGLKEQCQEVVDDVVNLCQLGKVRVNAVGLSRGAIACIYLAKRVSKIDGVEVNLLLFDPVPGNLIFSQTIDLLGVSTANQAMDLSECENLKNVVAIYPVEPLPDILCHAPLFPTYPRQAVVSEYPIPGCHQGALFSSDVGSDAGCSSSFYLIHRFLTQNGTDLAASPDVVSSVALESMLSRENRRVFSSRRCAHAVSFMETELVGERNGVYLNCLHEEVALGGSKRGDQENFSLKIIRTENFIPMKTVITGIFTLSMGAFGLWAVLTPCALSAEIATLVGGLAVLSVLWPVMLGIGVTLLAGAAGYYLHRKHHIFSREPSEVRSPPGIAVSSDFSVPLCK